jgi:hypothetical protein
MTTTTIGSRLAPKVPGRSVMTAIIVGMLLVLVAVGIATRVRAATPAAPRQVQVSTHSHPLGRPHRAVPPPVLPVRPGAAGEVHRYGTSTGPNGDTPVTSNHPLVGTGYQHVIHNGF